jgi:hypothetical protein
MNKDLQDFEQFMKQREQAARAYVSGEAEPLARISTQNSPATFFNPGGGYVQGAEQVLTTYKNDANYFVSGETNFEILQMAASDGLAYWVGFQRATVRLNSSDKDVPFNLRITEIFRREGNEWKLIHRHADSLAAGPEENKQ